MNLSHYAGTCRSCQAPILWALSPNAKTLPLDARSVALLPAPAPKTQYRLEAILAGPDAGKLQALPAGETDDAQDLYVSHFATCPNAGQHSSKGPRR